MPSAYDLDSIRAKLALRQRRLIAANEPRADDVYEGDAAESPALVARAAAVLANASEAAAAALPAPDPVPVAPGDDARCAAVAAILRPGPTDTEVLLIRRAERVGDPWSGHMALPGGHREPNDPDLRATALRETLEEIGVDLHRHEYLGALDELPATIRGRRVGIRIAPHVFALREEVRPRPNHEVAEVIWAPLGAMARGEVDAMKEWSYEGALRRVPAFLVHGHIVWGLTHHMLCSLFEALE